MLIDIGPYGANLSDPDTTHLLSVTKHPGDGLYFVTFDVDVSRCAKWVNFGTALVRFAALSQGETTSEIRVQVLNNTNTPVNEGFTLQMLSSPQCAI
ncbi:hypothetical protein [Nocardioides sp. P5_E3]